MLNSLMRLQANGYKFEIGEKNFEESKHNGCPIFVTTPSHTQIVFSGPLDQIITFDVGNISIDVSQKELVKEYYAVSDDEMSIFEYGYDKKSRDFLSAREKYIGLINKKSFNSVYFNIDEEEVYLPRFDVGHAVVGIYNGIYMVQVVKQTGLDSYINNVLYFDHKPLAIQILCGLDIMSIEQYLYSERSMGRIPEKLKCFNCGREVHWTDIFAESMSQALQYLKENYCGFC